MAVSCARHSFITSSGQKSLKKEAYLCHLRYFVEILKIPDIGKILQWKSCKYVDQKHYREAVPCTCAGHSPSEGFQLGSCHTWEFLFLHCSCLLGPVLPRSMAAALPYDREAGANRYLQLKHLLHQGARVKTFNNSSAHINSYNLLPLLCNVNIKMSQKPADCQMLF